MRQLEFFLLLLVAAAVILTSGCTADQSEVYHPGEEQAVRITVNALKFINSGSEPYTLSYSVRSS
jgi:predicted component of type VI protein secretion system